MLNTLKVIRQYLSRLLKKYTNIWKKKLVILNRKKFDSELVYGNSDKHIKTKIKTHGDNMNTNFQGI